MDIRGEIDRSSPMPYYHQLRELIQASLEREGVAARAQLPSEVELCERFGVSRTVVRRALLELELDGLIYRQKGRGSFVAPPKLRRRISVLSSFTQDWQEHGASPGARVLSQGMHPVGEVVARHLQIAPGTTVFRLQRVRLVNDEPMVVQTAYLHFDGCARLVDEDFEDRSLYEILSTKYGIIAYQAEEEYEASIVRASDAALLGLRSGSPVMFITRTTYNDDLVPFECVRSVGRADKYRYVGLLRRIDKVPSAIVE
jgi:GntR family transcriptional regulator